MRTSKLLLAALSLLVGLALVGSHADAQHRRRGPRRGHSEWFTIVSEGGLCFDVHGAEAGRDGARVQMWACHGGPNQLWRFERGMLMSAAGGCLDVHGGDLASRPTNGPLARVQTWSCHGGPNQRWSPEPHGALSSAAGGCLDVEAGAMHQNGARVISWTCHGQENQRFRMLPAARHAPPPPPLVVAAPQAMDEASFATFLARIESASFSADRVGVVRDTAPYAWLTAAQVTRVLAAMSFSSERTEVIELLAPRLVDRQNAGIIIDSLPFSSEREGARQVLARYAQPAPGW